MEEGGAEPLPPPLLPTLPPVAVAAPVLLWVGVLLYKQPVELGLGPSVQLLPLGEAPMEGVGGDTVVQPTTATPCRQVVRLPLTPCAGLRGAGMVPVPLPAAPRRVGSTESTALALPPPSTLSVAVQEGDTLDPALLLPPATGGVGGWLGRVGRLPLPVAPAARLRELLLLAGAPLLLAERAVAVEARPGDWEAAGESVPVEETAGKAEALPLPTRLCGAVRLEDCEAEAQREGEGEGSPAVGVEPCARKAGGVADTKALGVREGVALGQGVVAELVGK